jgi:hypothetical protein
MTRWTAMLAAASLAVGLGICNAAEYTYSLPELLGSPQGEQNLAVDLGGEFTSISSARLRIAGWHTPGLLGDLRPNPNTFPYPALINAYSPAEPFAYSGILGELLPTVEGPFEVDEGFHRIRPGGPPDFSRWLDGTANFYFSAGPSAYILIYRTIADPVVNITSATLVVTGDRLGASASLTADFDGDGTVDGDDLGWWRTAFGSGGLNIFPGADGDGDADGSEFLAWQRQLGSGAVPAAATAVPEPQAAIVALTAAVHYYRRRRR